VITTNVEHQFIKAGFPVEKVFAVQGDYGLSSVSVDAIIPFMITRNRLRP